MNEEQQTLFKGRDKRKKGWFWMDNDYLNGFAQYFGAIGTAIYVSLCRHTDNETQKCFPAMKTIAEEVGISETTVKKYIHLFELYKLIGIEKERDYKTKKWLNNIYTLLDKSEWLKPDKPLWKKKRKKSHSQPLTMDSHSQPLSEPQATIDESHRQPLPHKEDSAINKTHIKVCNAGVAGKEINLLIEKFKPINPSYERLYPNKTQRSALERMVKKWGADKVGAMIDQLPQIISQKFAPRITTPIQLEEKLGAIKAFLDQQKNNKIAIMPI